MEYNHDQIIQIEEYAQLFLKISEIAILADIDEDTLRNDIGNKFHPIHKTYYRAKLSKIAMLRKQEIEQAELGSSVAIELVSKYIQEQQIDE